MKWHGVLNFGLFISNHLCKQTRKTIKCYGRFQRTYCNYFAEYNKAALQMQGNCITHIYLLFFVGIFACKNSAISLSSSFSLCGGRIAWAQQGAFITTAQRPVCTYRPEQRHSHTNVHRGGLLATENKQQKRRLLHTFTCVNDAQSQNIFSLHFASIRQEGFKLRKALWHLFVSFISFIS